MQRKKKDIFLLIALILALIILNYPFLDNITEDFLDSGEKIHVDRIIDGDTIESNSTSIRLLGINTPERGEFFYEESKAYLESRILNQTVNLKYTRERYDKYNRVLAYVFLDNKNINVELVEQGYANYYFYGGRDSYSDELEDAWNKCINNNVNLCEKSVNSCSSCVNIDNSGGFIINNCGFSCDINSWEIKTEGREKFIFNGTLASGQTAEFSLDTSNSGGSLFLRDDEGRLAGWILSVIF